MRTGNNMDSVQDVSNGTNPSNGWARLEGDISLWFIVYMLCRFLGYLIRAGSRHPVIAIIVLAVIGFVSLVTHGFAPVVTWLNN